MKTFKIDGRRNTDSTNLNNNNTLEYTKYYGTYTIVVKNEDRLTVAIIAEDVSKEEAQNIINEYLVNDKEVLEVEDKAITIKQALQIKPVYILAVDYNSGSLADMLGEYNRDDNSHNEYLADITIQYHSLVDNACLSFTIECLVSVVGDIVTIEEMNTCSDTQAVYAHNIDGLYDGHVTIGEYGCIDIDYHDMLQSLIEEQPIYDIPKHFTIESY